MLLRAVYNGIVVPAARLALPAAARVAPKVARGVAARRGLIERWRAAGRRADGTPRVWVHASSAGETLQARPLLEGIRAARPDAALFYSWFSPSAVRWVEGWEAPDHADYMPFDVKGRVRETVDALAPDLLLLVSAELWPNLVWEATARGVDVAQACCRFGAGAGRLAWPLRPFTRDLYRRLTAVACVTEADRRILLEMGVEPGRVTVAGDTRADVTLARATEAAGASVWEPPADRGPVVVAGSTWPADDRIVVPAVGRLAAERPGLLAVLAPHEPTDEALGRLSAAAAREGLAAERMGALDGGPAPDVVLVDRVGVLAGLYGAADVAYVGGGFGGAVHNTMEPAARGVPVAVGPDHGAPAEVLAFERAGGLAVVDSAEGLAAAWQGWLADGGRAGAAARAALEELAGATARTLAFLRARGLPA